MNSIKHSIRKNEKGFTMKQGRLVYIREFSHDFKKSFLILILNVGEKLNYYDLFVQIPF